MKLKLVACALLLVACKKRGLSTESASDQGRAEEADHTARGIIYIREPRAGLCFAYLYEERGYGNATTGGPALANVSCGLVERHLTNVVEAPSKDEGSSVPSDRQAEPARTCMEERTVTGSTLGPACVKAKVRSAPVNGERAE